MRILEITNDTNAAGGRKDYGFIGVQHLAKKFNRTTEEIVNLFIDCEYSIFRMVSFLEKSGASA